jgi:hypothetical protein
MKFLVRNVRRIHIFMFGGLIVKADDYNELVLNRLFREMTVLVFVLRDPPALLHVLTGANQACEPARKSHTKSGSTRGCVRRRRDDMAEKDRDDCSRTK